LTMAEGLGKKTGFLNAKVHAHMSVVDDWWSNIDMKELLYGLPIRKAMQDGNTAELNDSDYEKIAEYVCQHYAPDVPVLVVPDPQLKERFFSLDVGLANFMRYL